MEIYLWIWDTFIEYFWDLKQWGQYFVGFFPKPFIFSQEQEKIKAWSNLQMLSSTLFLMSYAVSLAYRNTNRNTY